ncbi:M48 family metallopeptidase [Candidatus Dependentiae bacterium]|nr:M48 family metallopeptidase [Candidatus Dependentiae bacterium]
MKKHKLKFGSKDFYYIIKKGMRKTLKINVYPSLKVEVLVPLNANLDFVHEKVNRKRAWIYKQIEYFKSLPPEIQPRKYISGETHRYLGKQYRLKVIPSNFDDVKLSGGYFNLYSTKSKIKIYKEKQLETWYREHAKIQFNRLMNTILEKISKYNISEPKLIIKKMRKRWGSCLAKKNTVILNLHLIKVSSYCIEYVIYHELCHLKYPNHNKKFYYFLELVLPTWKKRKKELEQFRE